MVMSVYCTLILFGLNDLSALQSTLPQKVAHNFFCHFKTILFWDAYLLIVF